ncbi:nucleotidyltransferase family protein [Nocardioides sp. SYSU D00038]|uniref:nucleotidyltransferase family protein n=1 Tax=Nocardioides sp. SYSU D00038 TaxID=2812554 RepID=UPI0027DE3929|nr:nucleotidyltransferase family protein [Nocardioides sp. SYSU D00038]
MSRPYGPRHGLLLAAGAGRRMGRPKALVEDEHGSWLVRGVATLVEGGCDEVTVVLGAAADEAVRLLDGLGVDVVVAHDWADGMAASLAAGLRSLGTGVAVVHLVDLPDVTPEVVRRVAAGADADTLARAVYAGRPGHPVVIGSDHWPGVLDSLDGDTGARGYLAAQGAVDVECGDLATGRDVDSR